MRKTFLSIFSILLMNLLFAQDSTLLILKFNLKGNITPSVWKQTKKVFAEANKLKANIILIDMNTCGGTIIDTDSIRTKILNCKIPVWAFIDNKALSTGALISIACNRIYMKPKAIIGAQTSNNQTGEKVLDKYQSYFRNIMRATAQSHGTNTIIKGMDTITKWVRDPNVAEAMINKSIYLPGITVSGKALTFKSIEAQKNGFCDGIVNDVDELLLKANIKKYEIKESNPTVLDLIIGFLTSPVASGILILAIFGGIYFEMQSPGIRFPLVVAITAMISFFAPLSMEGLAENWEIALFIIGLILLAIEIFVVPGSGITGILGVSFIFAGLTLSLLNNERFNFENVQGHSILIALITVSFSLITGFFLSLWLSKKLFSAQS